MGQQTKSAHLLTPLLGSMAGMAFFFGFLPMLIYLGFSILKNHSVSLVVFIAIYISSLVACFLNFWYNWKGRISQALKTKNWSIFIPKHPNLWFAISCIFFDIGIEVLLIKTALTIKASLIWVFFSLICSKAIGNPIQMICCDFFGRKNILILSISLLVCIGFILNNYHDNLTFKIIFSLIIAKGIFGNLTTISTTILADHMEINY